MATTAEDIKRWWKSAKKAKAKYMVVVCDSFDYEDYHVECMTAEEARRVVAHPGEMQHVMEVYDMSLPFRDNGRVWDQIED